MGEDIIECDFCLDRKKSPSASGLHGLWGQIVWKTLWVNAKNICTWTASLNYDRIRSLTRDLINYINN